MDINIRQMQEDNDESTKPISPEGGSGSNNEPNKENTNSVTGDYTGLPGTNSSAYLDRDDIKINSKGNVSNPRLSYFKQNPQEILPSQGRDFLEDMTRLNNELEDIPPSFYESYTHKASKDLFNASRSIIWNNGYNTGKNFNDNHKFNENDSCYFRLGSFTSIIPPEFIQVSSVTSSDSIHTLRSTGPTNIKHGYIQRTITVQLFMSTIDGINGTKIESAFGYDHYINGLRHLLGMFKFTPFVPVVNKFLNIDNGIFNVGLHKIQISTVEGFPNTVSVNLTLKEFLSAPYIGLSEKMFEDAIIWPLFDFYIQRNIRHKDFGLGMIKNGNFNANLKFSILNSSVLSSSKDDEMDSINYVDDKIYTTKNENGKVVIDMLDDRNYIEKININNINATVNSIILAAGNTMPSIQLSGHDSPTFQYLGGTSTEFIINIETKDKNVITSIDNLLRDSIRLVRSFAYKTGIGFIKIDNELFDLFGIKYVIINDVVVNTVPGFPDLRQIEITGVGYDIGQKDREKFKSFRPFYDVDDKEKDGKFKGRKGTIKDMIKQNPKGHANKVLQDSVAEAKLMATELYPDLRLPRYSTVEWALSKIKEFNNKHGLSNDGIPDTLPRPKAMIPGKGEKETEYNGYVDPDFYVSYFLRASQIDPSGASDRKDENKEENDRRFNKFVNISNDKLNNTFNDINATGNFSKDINSVLTSMENNNIDFLSSMFAKSPYKPHEVIEPKFVPGYEPSMQIRVHTSFINEGKSSDELLIDKLNSWLKIKTDRNDSFNGVGGDLSSALVGQPGDNTKLPKRVKKVTGIPFIDILINRAAVECGYLYGAAVHGEICTEKRIQEEFNEWGSKFVNVSATRKWIGRQVWDCSSFVVFALRLIGIDIPRISSNHFSSKDYPHIFEDIPRSEAQPGDIFYKNGHVCVYCGDGIVVHARGAKYGCVINKHNYKEGAKYTCGLTSRVKNLKEYCDKFLKEHPDFYLEDDNEQARTINSSIYENAKKIINEERTTKTPSSEVKLGTFPNEKVKIGEYTYTPYVVNKWDDLILKNALKYNLDPNMIKAIIMIESSGRANLYNGFCCYGLMQIYASVHNVSASSMYDPDKNINKGCSIFAEYGKYKYINYDKKWWLASYNAGPGSVQAIQAGKKKMPKETVNYIKKFDVFYDILMKNGGNPGNTKSPIGASSPSNNNNSNSEQNTSTNIWFEKDDKNQNLIGLNVDKLSNLSAGFIHKTILKNINPKTFAKSYAGVMATGKGSTNKIPKSQQLEYSTYLSRSSNKDTDEKINLDDLGIAMIDSLDDKELDIDVSKISKLKAFSNEDEIVERMFVDTKTYNVRGRLLRAFPSYIFMIIDEHDNWIDESKFWSNYYIYQNILSIDVHSTYNNPVSTAKVSLSNVHKNIREYIKEKSLTEMVLGKDKKVDLIGRPNDSEYNVINQWAYLWFGSIPFEQITDELIEMRNTLYEEIYLREGTRIHIRLGYGSCPANYAPVFSGSIYEIVDDGDIVTIAAQSDGVELVSNVLTDRTSATNKDLGLPEEGGDIVAALLCNRENEFMYSLTGGRSFIDNTYGINHFGLYRQGKDSGWTPLSWSNADPNSSDVLSVVDVAIGGLSGGVAGFLASGFNPAMAVVGAVVGGTLITPLMFNNVIRRKKYEYDLTKNIYKATYDGVHMYDPQFLWMDGETNFRFFCYDRTPWDAMKMCEKVMPGFVCYPRPFSFDYRLFFGLPQWQCKYRYERKDSTNEVYEFAKSFAQVNIATTMYDIIENRVSVTSKNHITNLIGVYSLGGDLASTPVIMSDFAIDRSKQKTATIDTTSTQNFKGLPNILDKALEWVGLYDNGKHQAIRICLSELVDSWLNTYTGELLLLGSPDVMPFNYIYIDDSYADMIGVAKVKTVVHSLNGYSGYTTSVHPGLISTSTLDSDGLVNLLASIINVGSSVCAYIKISKWQSDKLNQINKILSECDWYNDGKKYLKVKGKRLVRSIKRNTLYKDIINIIDDKVSWLLQKVSKGSIGIDDVVSKIKSLGVVAKSGAKIAVTGGKIVVSATAFVLTSLITKFLTDIFDYFRYRNCIRIFPLYRRGIPFTAGTSGQQTLISDRAKELAGRLTGEDIYEKMDINNGDYEDAYITGQENNTGIIDSGVNDTTNGSTVAG